MCNIIVCFLHSQRNSIYFLLVGILHTVFLVLLMQVVVEFVFVLVCINDVGFLILIVTFPEKFGLLYSLIACLNEYHSELRQNKYCSILIVLVNMCFLYLVDGVFHQHFLFFRNVTGMYDFSSLKCLYAYIRLKINFPVFMSIPFLYSTSILEFCGLYIGVRYLEATSVSG